jgi:hypothetical protein
MTGITRDDVRAAVAAGTMTEAQAASLIVLAEARAGVRAHLSGLDEPFELFKGFNEIFIVVGLTILYMGFAGITGMTLFGTTEGFIFGMIYAAVGMAAVIASGALLHAETPHGGAVHRAGSCSPFLRRSSGFPSSAMLDLNTPATLTASAGIAASANRVLRVVPDAVHRRAHRDVGFATVFGLATFWMVHSPKAADIFLLTADGPFAIHDLGPRAGIGLVIAMMFDMSDPHRVTRRAAAGFWLHVIAAPAIVNTVALTCSTPARSPAQVGLAAFIALMAVFAVIIDRRSFLVSGVGYVVALAITVAEGQAFFIILILGAGLVLLGAQWEVMRRAIMRTLPAFPGKTRLPPYDLLQKETPA